MHETNDGPQGRPDEVGPYEAPRVESIVSFDDVEREAHYGGFVSMT